MRMRTTFRPLEIYAKCKTGLGNVMSNIIVVVLRCLFSNNFVGEKQYYLHPVIILFTLLADSATAKELLLMATSIDEQKQWVMNLSQKVVQPSRTKRYCFHSLSI